MAYIFARTAWKLEWFCKIKNSNLSFWVGGFVSRWVLRRWVCEFISFWVCELMYSLVVGFSWVYKPMSTSYVRGVLILTYFSHQKDDKHLSIYRKIKSQDGFIKRVVSNSIFWVKYYSFIIIERSCLCSSQLNWILDYSLYL